MTLVELLIALALSLMVIGGAISVFMSSKQGLRLEMDLSNLQDSFRFISNRLYRDLSQVGYIGCPSPSGDGSSTIFADVTGINVAELIRGTEGGAGPDEITVSYALPESGAEVLENIMSNSTDPLPVSSDTPLYKGLKDNFGLTQPKPTTLLVGNCKGAEIFLVTGVEEQDVDLDDDGTGDITAGLIRHQAGIPINGIYNNHDDLTQAYGGLKESISKVFELEEVSFRIDPVNGGLFERRNSGDWNLLFENVTDMQILYGIASNDDGNADHYVDWSNGLNITTITSLRVTLTFVVTESEGVEVTRDYTFVVKLRNMGLA